MNSTSKVFMVRPVCFGFNEQTSANNAFQSRSLESVAQDNALREFDAYVATLQSKGIEVVVVEDTLYPCTPDSIFPNNWFSTHQDGTLVLYPMYAPNRRSERKVDALNTIYDVFNLDRVVDMTDWESKGLFLEGTGSLVLDREAKVAYACRSPRTSEDVLADFCQKLGYSYILFDAVDSNNRPIYHTNVMMSIGTDVAIVCESSIKSIPQLESVKGSLSNRKTIVDISFEQMSSFAGNMLEVQNQLGQRYMVMSQRAYDSLLPSQINTIEKSCEVIKVNIPTIEITGGGSARCMIAEIY